MSDPENTRRLVLAIIDFLQSQMTTRNDLSLEDREGLEIAMECLILAYDVENTDYIQRRPLMDMFLQVANPVSIENKQQAESHKMSGNAKMLQELYNEAEEEYSRAIQLDKWNAVYYCNRASARNKMEQYFEAISDCRQALLLNPDYAKAYARMGQAYALMNRPRRAARCYRQALELDPDNERYRNNLRVAEGQAAEQPNMDMENLINSIVSSLFLGGSPMPGGPGMRGAGPSFMIISDPHTEDHCPISQSANETNDSSTTDTNSSGENQNTESNKNTGDKNEGNETSERRSQDESLHLRVLLGIPVMSDEDDSSADSNSKKHQTMGQHNILEERSKNGEQNSTHKEAQNEVEVKKENANNKNADDKSPLAENSKITENSKNEDKLKKKDAVCANAVDKSPHQESSKEQEKSKTESQKNNIPSWSQGSQNSLFGKVDNSVPYKKNQSVKKDLERQRNNTNLIKTEEKGQPGPSQRSYSFKHPEGDAKQTQQSSGISMADIANFFRNITRADRENANGHNDNQPKRSFSKENEKRNDQNKEKYPQGHASISPGNQSDKLPLPENKPSKEKEEEKKAEKEASSSDTKQETDENSGTNNKSKADEEENKN
ncbi:Small glutamine-rich tetratricopeptide repeat-containing protein alpha [Araneus ventricosus]|uniref:Small glutamine-rich tetratricopeptide repeat-containing protein alpha n=1 Tax=Araneus ventricosus TaxID=182803 RepID=A0A4Y2PN44_ARAVE|nr:Small glutamine-rich tetratricopeptide repeat-containing protein alpha [Araneus ventricosus]GBN52547.1 Small glutamine-rich tetratricopeptide repeat-containing protein alpha [Araneus ventricosus]